MEEKSGNVFTWKILDRSSLKRKRYLEWFDCENRETVDWEKQNNSYVVHWVDDNNEYLKGSLHIIKWIVFQ